MTLSMSPAANADHSAAEARSTQSSAFAKKSAKSEQDGSAGAFAMLMQTPVPAAPLAAAGNTLLTDGEAEAAQGRGDTPIDSVGETVQTEPLVFALLTNSQLVPVSSLVAHPATPEIASPTRTEQALFNFPSTHDLFALETRQTTTPTSVANPGPALHMALTALISPPRQDGLPAEGASLTDTATQSEPGAKSAPAQVMLAADEPAFGTQTHPGADVAVTEGMFNLTSSPLQNVMAAQSRPTTATQISNLAPLGTSTEPLRPAQQLSQDTIPNQAGIGHRYPGADGFQAPTPAKPGPEKDSPVLALAAPDLAVGTPAASGRHDIAKAVPQAAPAGHPQLFAAYAALTKPVQPGSSERAELAMETVVTPAPHTDGAIRNAAMTGAYGPGRGDPATDRSHALPHRNTDSVAQPPFQPVDKPDSRPAQPKKIGPGVLMAAPAMVSVIDASGPMPLLTDLHRHDTVVRNADPTQTALHGTRATAIHIASQLAQAVSQTSGGTTDITLNPRELGHVRLSLQAIDGTMYVAIAAERPETAELMRRHIDSLAQEFRGLGYQDVSFSFSGRQGGNGPGQDTGFGQNPDTGPAQPLITSEELPADRYVPRRAAAQTGGTGLDLRL